MVLEVEGTSVEVEELHSGECPGCSSRVVVVRVVGTEQLLGLHSGSNRCGWFIGACFAEVEAAAQGRYFGGAS